MTRKPYTIETRFILNLQRDASIPMLLVVYLVYLFVFTFMPFKFSFDSPPSFFSPYQSKFESIASIVCCTSAGEVFSNLLLFVPFGFLLVALPGFSRLGLTTKVLFSILAACALSFAIESLQLFLARDPSMVDVLLNTVGGATGAWLGIRHYLPLIRLCKYCLLYIQKNQLLPLVTVVYVSAIFWGANFRMLPTDFSNWDLTYPFQLGNEATLDRSWLGEIFMVAIYHRTLTQEEILANFKAGGLGGTSENRVQDGIVAFYDFSEGSGTVIHDRAPYGSPLDLAIRDPEHITWQSPNGIKFEGNTIISGKYAAEKLYFSDIPKRSDLTIEVWIATDRLDQTGPSRIVSYSKSSLLRNFTLSQDERNLEFRLRTPLTGLNGLEPALQTTDEPLTPGIHHVVATYGKGIERLYVDGQERTTILLDGRQHLTLFYSTGKWAYWFVVFFPIGFFLYLIFLRKLNCSTKAILLSSFTGFVIVAVIEVIPVMITGRQMDIPLIVVGAGVTLLSSLTSATLSNNVRIS